MGVRSAIIRGLLKLERSNLFNHYDRFLDQEQRPVAENRRLQEESLARLVIHAHKNCRYYRGILAEADVVTNGEVRLENFHLIPALTKEIIRSSREDLISGDVDEAGRRTYEETSGGSMGEPVSLIQDRDFWDANMGAKWHFSTFAGKVPGDREVRLWGSERDILRGSMGLKSIATNKVLNRVWLNSFKMSPANMGKMVATINRFKPTLIEAYVQSIAELAAHCERNGLKVHPPKAIITTAGTLHAHQKKHLEEVFGTTVLNRYGSREVGDIACSCPEDRGLHLNTFNAFVEILDEEMRPVSPGERGQVHITNLTNYSMPLIRFRIGDMAIASKEELCTCGRGYPLIEHVVGRTVEQFVTRAGDLIDGEYFTHLLYFKPWIEKFQVVQKDYDFIEIRVVKSGTINTEDVENIERDIVHVMGSECEVQFEYVDRIDPMKSGKYIYTRCDIR